MAGKSTMRPGFSNVKITSTEQIPSKMVQILQDLWGKLNVLPKGIHFLIKAIFTASEWNLFFRSCKASPVMKYFLPSLCGLIVMCSFLLFAIPYLYQQNISSIRHTRSNLHRLENNEKLNWDSEFKLLTDVIWIILRSYFRNKSHVHLDLIW